MSKNNKINIATAPKKSEIETIRKKTTDVERSLHSLQTISKTHTNLKDINKWQRAIEEKIDYLSKAAYEINNTVNDNVKNIVEIKATLQHNYENIKTIFDILKHSFEQDKKDKKVIYKAFKKKLPF